MPKTLFILLISTILSITGLHASDNDSYAKDKHHSHSCESNEWNMAYQFGYTEIRSKNNHMSDDSGAFFGIHLMKAIENDRFNKNFHLGAGAHITSTEDMHIALMLGIMYSLNERTMISIMPGLMFMKHETPHSNMGMGHMHVSSHGWETEEAIHIEISRTINLFSRILNPSFSWMSSSSHNQYSFGLNFNF